MPAPSATGTIIWAPTSSVPPSGAGGGPEEQGSQSVSPAWRLSPSHWWRRKRMRMVWGSQRRGPSQTCRQQQHPSPAPRPRFWKGPHSPCGRVTSWRGSRALRPRQGLGTPPMVFPGLMSPQNSRAPPSSLLTTSSSVSSLSSSTLSSSLMSLYSESELGRVAVRGCVQFSLCYDPAKKELQVHVLRCRELAEAKKQRSDPYIKTYLLPDKSNRSKRKTTVRKRSLDPIFNETLKYKLEKRDLQGRALNLSVWHHDSLGRNLFLGEVEIALGTWDWDNTGPEWFSLQPRMPIPSDGLASRGSLNLALKFIPAGLEGGGLPPTGELHIWVKDAQSLIPLQSGSVDAFVQCYVLPDDSKASRQKTRVVKRSLNPLFNHTMVYDGFQAKDLAEACAEFTLWHHEAFSKRQLGGIRLSLGTGSSYGLPVGWMDSTAEERGVWGRLLQQPGQWVEALLPLRTNLVPRA
ncbi:synaptotagmin-like protein 1 isoform X5 [Strigops habroptila]|uniref:synaptotagmin-like protein 1 isoform X5 n=1 Tax=Strigops habroptila TaxID=2489341 RepID=UPI0011CFD026|nr:synaptotagmin-like protein 1 isoform X5 [Strigops habroptila]